tara:strand:- start:225 stop:869 length:645 start_codon:yes stop_codon:yes gene_type:complete
MRRPEVQYTPTGRTTAAYEKKWAEYKKHVRKKIEEGLPVDQQDMFKFLVECTASAMRKQISNIERQTAVTILTNCDCDLDNLAGLDRLVTTFGGKKGMRFNNKAIPADVKHLLFKTAMTVFGGNERVSTINSLFDDIINRLCDGVIEADIMAGMPKQKRERKEPKAKPKNFVEKRAMNARAKRDEWQRKFEQAQKKLKQYERKVRYYEKKEAGK